MLLLVLYKLWDHHNCGCHGAQNTELCGRVCACVCVQKIVLHFLSWFSTVIYSTNFAFIGLWTDSFSALKYKGRRLSDFAYAGEPIPESKLSARSVTSHRLVCTSFNPPYFTLGKFHCYRRDPPCFWCMVICVVHVCCWSQYLPSSKNSSFCLFLLLSFLYFTIFKNNPFG